MDYLVRLVQVHEDFRLPEIRSLASFFGIEIEILSYSPDSPILIIRILSYPTSKFPSSTSAAKALISRSVLSWGIYELWGRTPADHNNDNEATYAALHADVKTRTNPKVWSRYKASSFKFSLDSYCGKRSPTEQREIIDSFRYLGLEGPIRMQNPEVEFSVFEEWSLKGSPHHQVKELTPATDIPSVSQQSCQEQTSSHPPSPPPSRKPHRLLFGLLIAQSPRNTLTLKHDLKRRPYISTTSMDATLALVSANLAHAGPEKIIYDPFVGTGGLLVAAAEFGSWVCGSDIDGRSFRGRKGEGRGNGEMMKTEKKGGVWRNFEAYGLEELFGDCFVGDLIHAPLRKRDEGGRRRGNDDDGGWLDGIICDPPYGVREGLKVLGNRDPRPDRTPHMIDGVPAHTLPGYVAPKKPYSFERMLDDILAFAADTLVVDGRLAFWMPSANEDEEVLAIPSHKDLYLMECCVQRFNKWSRRLLVYRRRRKGEQRAVNGPSTKVEVDNFADGKTASELNSFRRKYFQGFQT